VSDRDERQACARDRSEGQGAGAWESRGSSRRTRSKWSTTRLSGCSRASSSASPRDHPCTSARDAARPPASRASQQTEQDTPRRSSLLGEQERVVAHDAKAVDRHAHDSDATRRLAAALAREGARARRPPCSRRAEGSAIGELPAIGRLDGLGEGSRSPVGSTSPPPRVSTSSFMPVSWLTSTGHNRRRAPRRVRRRSRPRRPRARTGGPGAAQEADRRGAPPRADPPRTSAR